jgi:hypothetical protein
MKPHGFADFSASMISDACSHGRLQRKNIHLGFVAVSAISPLGFSR